MSAIQEKMEFGIREKIFPEGTKIIIAQERTEEKALYYVQYPNTIKGTGQRVFLGRGYRRADAALFVALQVGFKLV